MNNDRGWICPVCGRGVSPNVDSCDCYRQYGPTVPPNFPYIPPNPVQPWNPPPWNVED